MTEFNKNQIELVLRDIKYMYVCIYLFIYYCCSITVVQTELLQMKTIVS